MERGEEGGKEENKTIKHDLHSTRFHTHLNVKCWRGLLAKFCGGSIKNQSFLVLHGNRLTKCCRCSNLLI